MLQREDSPACACWGRMNNRGRGKLPQAPVPCCPRSYCSLNVCLARGHSHTGGMDGRGRQKSATACIGMPWCHLHQPLRTPKEQRDSPLFNSREKWGSEREWRAWIPLSISPFMKPRGLQLSSQSEPGLCRFQLTPALPSSLSPTAFQKSPVLERHNLALTCLF